MATKQWKPRPTTPLLVTNDNDDDDEHERSGNRKRLRQAQHLFLQRKHLQALSLCNRYFERANAKQSHNRHPSKNNKNKTNKKKQKNKHILLPVVTIQQFVIDDREDTKTPRRFAVVGCANDDETRDDEEDSLAAILIQSWQELYSKERNSSSKRTGSGTDSGTDSGTGSGGWNHLQPVVDWYSNHNHPMSMEFFVTIWIPFWEHHGYRLEAFEWTRKVLLSFHHRTNENETKEEEEEEGAETNASSYATTYSGVKYYDDDDQLWRHCFLEQLPRLADANTARYIAQSILFGTTTTTHVVVPNQVVFQNEIQMDSVKSLIAVFERVPEHNSKNNNDDDDDENENEEGSNNDRIRQLVLQSLKECLQEVSTATRSSTTNKDTNKDWKQGTFETQVSSTALAEPSATTVRQILGRSFRSSGSWKEWIRCVVRDFVFQHLSQNTTTTTSSSPPQLSSLWSSLSKKQRQTMAFTMVVTLLAWRKRRSVCKLTRAIVSLLLSPVTELIEAL